MRLQNMVAFLSSRFILVMLMIETNVFLMDITMQPR